MSAVAPTDDELLAAIRPLLPALAARPDTARIVGTASSRLRGIDITAGDIDILTRTRAVVDELSEAMAAAGGRRHFGPVWLSNPGLGQYFSEFESAGVRVEICTVEPPPGETLPFGECAGAAPWEQFDLVLVEGFPVPMVSSELRLHTEVARSRSSHWNAIATHLARHGGDGERLNAVLRELPPEHQDVVRAATASLRAGGGQT